VTAPLAYTQQQHQPQASTTAALTCGAAFSNSAACMINSNIRNEHL